MVWCFSSINWLCARLCKNSIGWGSSPEYFMPHSFLNLLILDPFSWLSMIYNHCRKAIFNNFHNDPLFRLHLHFDWFSVLEIGRPVHLAKRKGVWNDIWAVIEERATDTIGIVSWILQQVDHWYHLFMISAFHNVFETIFKKVRIMQIETIHLITILNLILP